MNVIIVGAGKIGSLIAHKLSDQGHRITIIEKNPTAAVQLPRGRINSGAITVIHQDGSTGSAMEKAGISDTDVFIASTGKDSLNGLAAQRALTVFGVDKVLAVVNDEDARSLYDSLGITTINKATIASNQIVQTIIAEQ